MRCGGLQETVCSRDPLPIDPEILMRVIDRTG
jgi:hypothetical protein